jgi:hypothetical protein
MSVARASKRLNVVKGVRSVCAEITGRILALEWGDDVKADPAADCRQECQRLVRAISDREVRQHAIFIWKAFINTVDAGELPVSDWPASWLEAVLLWTGGDS